MIAKTPHLLRAGYVNELLALSCQPRIAVRDKLQLASSFLWMPNHNLWMPSQAWHDTKRRVSLA